MFEFAAYRLQDTFEIIQNVAVPKPDDAVTVTHKYGGALAIGACLFRMLSAIELDYQLACRTGEICDVPTDRMLAAELPRQGALT